MILAFKPQFKEPILNGSKIHTIREDSHDRWKLGIKIHAATGVRSKNYDCFFESECVSTQEIIIEAHHGFWKVIIEGRNLKIDEIIDLAINDGFASHYNLLGFFFKNKVGVFKGKIIHWTDLRY